MSGRKCKGFRVLETEGYGKDQQRNGGTIEEILCRFNFPKFPLDKTEVLTPILVGLSIFLCTLLLMFDQDDGEETNKQNLLKIKKYLARQHYIDPKLKDPEECIKRFKQLDFGEILKDLNMTRETYINALRMTVKGKHQVFHQRKASDLHINQYNPGLLLLNGANMDFTWIAGNYQPFLYVNNLFPQMHLQQLPTSQGT